MTLSVRLTFRTTSKRLALLETLARERKHLRRGKPNLSRTINAIFDEWMRTQGRGRRQR